MIISRFIFSRWNEARFEPPILRNIEASKYVMPRKIQAYCIPLIAEGMLSIYLIHL